MLQRLDLESFKAFERFSLTLRGDAFVAGPNHAGKSTLIAAIRTVARMLRYASRRTASDGVLDRGNRVLAYPFAPGSLDLVDENLRHECWDIETRLVARFANGVRLTAVWPPEPNEQDPFFYILEGDIVLRMPTEIARPGFGHARPRTCCGK